MADAEINPQQSGKLQRFMVPLIVTFCVTGVLGLFAVGYLMLSTPELPPEEFSKIMEEATAEVDEKATDDQPAENTATDEPKELADGQFDFDKHRYYTFPLPFVSNLASGKGMLTVEIAIATYGNTLTGEAIIKKLETFNPKMRSAINLRLSEQKLADIDSVEKRKKLANQLLDDIKPIVDQPNVKQSSPVTDLHFVKFVISEAY
jgi:flagellar basal body-associated protein FliL